MSRALRASVLVLLVAAGSGCTRYYWSRSGATAEQFDRDNQDCADRTVRMLGPGAATDAVEQVYRSCLQGLRGSSNNANNLPHAVVFRRERR